ncbi:MAG TPA: T9SS type A sorting domain-containing protein [Candidatus Marinimicrobia bacterium]|nr:T9SS type A sorting domain-containing protein [Candidatus Neomarinimicrobiota bacterium]
MTLVRNCFNTLILLTLFAVTAHANVTVSIGDVSVDGYTEDIVVPVTLANPDDAVGGFQFDVIALPTLAVLSGATPVDGDNFSADFNVFEDGSGRVIFYSNNPDGIAAGGDNVVLNLHYDGSDILSALLDLHMFDLTVSDDDGGVIDGDGEDGSITIGDVVILSASSDTGDVSEEVDVDINLQNSGIVGGVQFDMYDTPDYLDVIGFSTTDRSSGFTVEYNVLESGATRIIMFDSNNGNIDAGTGPILNMELVIHDNAYNSNVGVNFENVIVTDDIGGTYWVAGADSGTVTVSPGYIEEPHNLVAQDGMDAQVLLTWDAPYGPIPADIEEDFEGGEIPEGWEVITNGNGWYVTENGSSNFWAIPAHSSYAVSNDDGFNGADTPDNDGNDYLVMPAINMSGAAEVTLNFASFFTGAYGQTAFVSVSTDGGMSFTDAVSMEPASEWVMTAADLSQYGGTQNVLVAFHANDNGGWASGWAVDDIVMTFSNARVTRHVHYELTELGIWAVTAEKQEVINTYPGGIPYDWRVDIQNPNTPEDRPVELDAYKVYRSLNSTTGFEELTELEGDVTTYLDEDVTNSTTYYYYVTAIYPDGSESGPTNVATATPVEWVELWMDNGASLSGQMDTLDFYINNETGLGLFYFEIMDYPDVINSLNILPTDRTMDWALEIADQGNGTMAITGISLGTPLSAGNGAVCRAVVYPDADEETVVNLSYTNGTAIQDVNYVDLNWTAESATYEVGIETQYATLTGGFGPSGGEFTTSFILANTQPVYGIQLDIVADPPFLSGSDIAVSGLHDFSTWNISADVVGTIYRVLMFDNTLSNPINPGISHIADLAFEIAAGVPEGTEVILNIDDAVISDVNNLPMHTEGIPGEVYIGAPPAAYSIQNVGGNLTPGGTGSFEVHMDNAEAINILEFTLADLPESMTVTGISGVGRFDDGIIDGSSYEQDDGTYYFLGYDFNTGIEVGSGAILIVDVQFDNNLYNSSIIMTMPSVAAGDAGANPVMALFHGFGQFTGYLSMEDEVALPDEFALHPNFPNPFNPSTKITYDLAQDSKVRLEIFDIRGRNVRTLVNDSQVAGRHIVSWNATDNFGQPVSAGVYLYRLHTANKVFTQKMILMK